MLCFPLAANSQSDPAKPLEKAALSNSKHENVWMEEGLSQYLAWRYLREKYPEQAKITVERAFAAALSGKADAAARRARAMLAWRTLETVIDRERVDAALRLYFERFAASRGTAADFRRIAEEISGRNLGWFFRYYVEGSGLPEITLRRLPSSAPNELQGEIAVKNAPPEFQVRVELQIATENGAVRHSLATRGAVTPFSVGLPAPALRVVVDPDRRILRR